jgi:hypothetical protein
MVEQSSLPLGRQYSREERQERARDKIPFKGMTQ